MNGNNKVTWEDILRDCEEKCVIMDRDRRKLRRAMKSIKKKIADGIPFPLDYAKQKQDTET